MVLFPSILLTRAAGATLRARLTVLAARLFTCLTASTALAGALRARRAGFLAVGLAFAAATFVGAETDSTFSATAFTGAATVSVTASIFSSILVSSTTSKTPFAAVQHSAVRQGFQAVFVRCTIYRFRRRA